MLSRKAVTALIGAAAIFTVCHSPDHEQIAKIGKVKIDRESLDAFGKVHRIYPAPLPHYFAERQPITLMADAEAVYQYVKPDSIRSKVRSSLDWKWKERYFTASLFFDLLNENLGFTDAELETYYKKHSELFRVQAKGADGQDSAFIPPFDDVRLLVADRVFYEKYPPDTAFIDAIINYDHDHNEETVRNHWLYQVRTNPADFYMRSFFSDNTGEVYKSIDQIYAADGSGLLTPEDLEVIRSWLPEGRRNMPMSNLVEWLYKWKTFAEHAEKRKLTGTRQHREMLYWALRIDHADAYLRGAVIPGLGDLVPDSAVVFSIAELIAFDNAGRTNVPVTRAGRVSGADNIAETRLTAAIDGALHNVRRRVRVTFLQDEFRDERGADPAALIAAADSRKEAAMDPDADPDAANAAMEEAERLLRTLSADYSFAPEGRRAMNEMAKILLDKFSAGGGAERHLLPQAVRFYRMAQALESDPEGLCSNNFMIGFTYDEHMKIFDLAEANYMWILRNTPNCELASDAEFMLLHLGEPMTSIEEIQGRSIRQGRKIDFDNEEAPAEDAAG